MRLLYFGTLDWGGTSLQRCEALRQLVRVYSVDSRMFLPEEGWGRGLRHKLQVRIGAGPLVRQAGRRLVREVRRYRPDWLWVDQGLLVDRETLADIRRDGASRVAHYTPDSLSSPGFENGCFSRAIGEYDLCFTTKPDEPERYSRWGAKRAIFTFQGYDPAIHRPVALGDEDKRRFEADVAFVGQRMEARAGALAVLARARKGRLALYGRHWEKGATGRLLGPLQRGWVYGDDYAKALCGAKIALGFLNREVGDTYTTRSFEIPACGVLLLAERTDLHRELFVEDREAVYFSSTEELIDKVGYYLDHEEERRRIAEAGRERSAAYTWRSRMAGCVEIMRGLG